MKKIFYSAIGAWLAFMPLVFAQPFAIEPTFNSSNGWMPDKVGDTGAPLYSQGPSYGEAVNINGQIYNISSQTSFIKDVSTKILRFGGIAHDINFYTQAQALDFIAMCKENNAEPLFQIPFLYFYHPTSVVNVTDALTSANMQQLGQMIDFLVAQGVKYFSISNENDHVYHRPPYCKNGGDCSTVPLPTHGQQLSAFQISEYFKPIAALIKSKKHDAIIFGPDLAQHDDNLVDGLIGGNGNIMRRIIDDPQYNWFQEPAGSPPIYFTDVWAWHTYPFGGTQTRQQV
ncbi:MAG: hypothetical protein H0X62_15940 [Bacteroidetes bacterium]|nr:hypothetical protein [Bacteroidota bacterium]